MSTAEAKEIFLGHIKRKGLRYTRQREVILNTFLCAGRHINAEELHGLLKKTDPDIGYATVHRNLKLMCECGVAEEIKIGNMKAIYEQKSCREHHDHLICIKCWKFIEVKDERIEHLQDELAAANEFKPLRHKMEIYGICRDCK